MNNKTKAFYSKLLIVVFLLFFQNLYCAYADNTEKEIIKDTGLCKQCGGTGKLIKKELNNLRDDSLLIDTNHNKESLSHSDSELMALEGTGKNENLLLNFIKNPYFTLSIGIILGLLLGFLSSNKKKKGGLDISTGRDENPNNDMNSRRKYPNNDVNSRDENTPNPSQSNAQTKKTIEEVIGPNNNLEIQQSEPLINIKSLLEPKKVYFRPMGDRKLGPGNGELVGKNNLYMIYAEIISTSKAKIHLALDMYKTEEVGMYDIIVFQNDKLLNYIDGKGSSGENHVTETEAGEAELINGVWTVTKPIKVRFS